MTTKFVPIIAIVEQAVVDALAERAKLFKNDQTGPLGEALARNGWTNEQLIAGYVLKIGLGVSDE